MNKNDMISLLQLRVSIEGYSYPNSDTPSGCRTIPPVSSGWYWIKANGTWVCVSNGAPDMHVIREQDIFTSENKVGI